MTKEQTVELNLLLATFRCFNEQLYHFKKNIMTTTNQYTNEQTVKSLQLRAMLPESLDINRNWNKLVLSTHNIKKLEQMVEFIKWREEVCSR